MLIFRSVSNIPRIGLKFVLLSSQGSFLAVTADLLQTEHNDDNECYSHKANANEEPHPTLLFHYVSCLSHVESVKHCVSLCTDLFEEEV